MSASAVSTLADLPIFDDKVSCAMDEWMPPSRDSTWCERPSKRSEISEPYDDEWHDVLLDMPSEASAEEKASTMVLSSHGAL